MDPYLENPAEWGNFHHGFIAAIQMELNQRLAPRYYVRVEERVYISDEDDPARRVIIPDARVQRGWSGESAPWASESGGIAIAEPIVRTTLIEEETREAFLNIFDAQFREVVTVIEVLRPSNKVRGSRARESFVKKRREVMNSPAHWMEIDLLREGTPALPPDIQLPPCEYYVHVSRVQERPEGRIWPIRLREKLPKVGVPLREGDEDAGLDLQLVIDETYDRSAYQVSTDYAAAPVPPLPPDLATWADAILKQMGLRESVES
jgi:hypothetical protein